MVGLWLNKFECWTFGFVIYGQMVDGLSMVVINNKNYI